MEQTMENDQGRDSATSMITPNNNTLTEEEPSNLKLFLRFLHENGIGDGEHGQFSRARFLAFDDFLPAEGLAALLEHVLEHGNDFQASMVTKNDGDTEGVVNLSHRRSRVFNSMDEKHRNLIIKHVRNVLPDVLSQLRISLRPVEDEDIDAQVTACNNEEFFKLHDDTISGLAKRRILTFVYYFHREPKAFTGGELRLYNTVRGDNYAVPTPSFQTIVPQQNRIVFFPSFLLHEVVPVHCPSCRFEDSRFSINGWLNNLVEGSN